MYFAEIRMQTFCVWVGDCNSFGDGSEAGIGAAKLIKFDRLIGPKTNSVSTRIYSTMLRFLLALRFWANYD
jgi:hypothetical protein